MAKKAAGLSKQGRGGRRAVAAVRRGRKAMENTDGFDSMVDKFADRIAAQVEAKVEARVLGGRAGGAGAKRTRKGAAPKAAKAKPGKTSSARPGYGPRRGDATVLLNEENKRVCNVWGCTGKHRCRGYCARHYQQQIHHPTKHPADCPKNYKGMTSEYLAPGGRKGGRKAKASAPKVETPPAVEAAPAAAAPTVAPAASPAEAPAPTAEPAPTPETVAQLVIPQVSTAGEAANAPAAA